MGRSYVSARFLGSRALAASLNFNLGIHSSNFLYCTMSWGFWLQLWVVLSIGERSFLGICSFLFCLWMIISDLPFFYKEAPEPKELFSRSQRGCSACRHRRCWRLPTSLPKGKADEDDRDTEYASDCSMKMCSRRRASTGSWICCRGFWTNETTSKLPSLDSPALWDSVDMDVKKKPKKRGQRNKEKHRRNLCDAGSVATSSPLCFPETCTRWTCL